MGYSEELMGKYIKVHVLAERGATDGERAAAATIRGKMEAEHPGLGIEALRWRDMQEQAARGVPPPPPAPPPPPVNSGAQKPPTFIPSGSSSRPAATKWTDALGGLFQAVQGVAASAVNLEAGRHMAENVVRVERTHNSKVDIWRIAALINGMDVVAGRHMLNDSQKQAFARAVGEQVAVQLYSLLRD